jgi:hypothetical protein
MGTRLTKLYNAARSKPYHVPGRHTVHGILFDPIAIGGHALRHLI